MPVSRTSLIYDIAGQDNPSYTLLTGNAVVTVTGSWTSDLANATYTKYTMPYGFGSAVAGSDHMLYCAPRYFPNDTNANILVVNPDTKATHYIPLPAEVTLESDATMYSAGVRATNNIIVFVPFGADHILFVNTNNQSVQATQLVTAGSSYYSAVAAPNGLVYALGFEGWLTINPLTRTYTYTAWGAGRSGRDWEAGVLSVETNRIYFGPYNSANVLILDYANSTTSNQTYGLTFNGPGGSGQIVSGVNGGDGKIYWRSRPGFDGYWTVLDPSANTAVRDFGEVSQGATAVVLGSDGYAWGVGGPYVTTNRRTYVETTFLATSGLDDASTDQGNQAVLMPNGNCYMVAGGSVAGANGVLLELNTSGSATEAQIESVIRPPYY